VCFAGGGDGWGSGLLASQNAEIFTPPEKRADRCYAKVMSPPLVSRNKMMSPDQSFMLRLREALEASWDRLTAYQAVEKVGNPAFGQCYPTARVVQHYYPATEIIKGNVWTGESEEIHFWNGLRVGDKWYHIDFSWDQFPASSVVREFVILDRHNLGDSEATLERCALLLKRVETYLSNSPQPCGHGV
jgi:hypothetical protein